METTLATNIRRVALEPFVEALTRASGITEGQARICLLYALCTYRADLKMVPILAITGATGTGKSALLGQMQSLVNDPRVCTGATSAVVRNEMHDCKTYIIDEADKVSERLLLLRTNKQISRITYNEGTGEGWKGRTVDLFGATLLARRNPFRDSAVRNRAIVIRTAKNPGEYRVVPISGLDQIAEKMVPEHLPLGSGRVRDTWTPLLEIATVIDDPSYQEAVAQTIEAEQAVFASGQQYEASEVVLHALDKLTWSTDDEKRLHTDVALADLTATANDIGDVRLTKKQVEELLISMGFRVTFTHGTKFVRSDVKLLERLV